MGSFAIPLQVKPPEIASPLQTVGSLMALRGQMSEIALHNQQMATSRQQAADIAEQVETRHRTNQAQEKMTALLADPAVHNSIRSGDLTPLFRAGIPADVANNAVKGLGEFYKTTGELHDVDVKRHADGRALAAKTFTNVDPNDPNTADQLNSFAQGISKDYPDLAQQIPKFVAGPGLAKQIDDFKKSNGIFSAVLDSELAQRKTKAEVSSADALTAKNNAAAAKDQFELDLMKGATNGSQDQAIDQRFAGNPEAAQAAKDAFKANLPGGVKAALDAVNKVYDERIGAAKKIASETPAKVAEQAALLPGEVRKAGAVAAAEIPSRVAGAVQTQQALAKLSPDAFAGIADATSRHAAMGEYDKVDKEYRDKLNEGQRLRDTIAAAQAGNKAAPGIIPIEELRGFVNRVNSTELKGISTKAGSVGDQLQGYIDGKLKGQPIPPDLLRDMASLSTLGDHAAKRAYDAGLNRLKVRGVDVSKIAAPSGAAAGVVKWGRDAQGNPVPLSQ